MRNFDRLLELAKKNNGILENEIKIENQIIQRYWIINN